MQYLCYNLPHKQEDKMQINNGTPFDMPIYCINTVGLKIDSSTYDRVHPGQVAT